MKKLGYLRISTQEQSPDRQIDGLRSVCDELFIECASASTTKRPVYSDVISRLGPDDALVVWDLDRAFRSVVDALLEVDKLKARGIHLEIMNLQIDTNTPGGMLMYTVISAFAEFERRVLSQRTKEGLAAARARGKRIGRPPKLSMQEIDEAIASIRSGSTIRQVAQTFDIAPWSLSRAIKRAHLS
ncbi:MAG: recombinase family protein [Pseudomonadota bacterium]